MDYQKYLVTLENRLTKVFSDSTIKPDELYDPQRYIISLGGKRIRPLLSLIASDLFCSDYTKAIPSAICVELFHNFSLIHDDILDKAPLRRGNPTVHKKWNTNIAILSGDAMLVRAFIELNKSAQAHRDALIQLFSKTAIEICEGQQEDMNFELMESVTVDEYTTMITKKTAVLLACSLQMGAICAGADQSDAKRIYNCGKHLGIAFQLKDDVLDVFADQQKFGKQVGGDILANKKTYLLLKALELSNSKQKKQIRNWLNAKKFNKKEKVQALIAIYNELNIREISESEINKHFQAGLGELKKIKKVDPAKKEKFKQFCFDLMQREK